MNLKTMLLVNYFQLGKHLHHYVFVATMAEGYMVTAHHSDNQDSIPGSNAKNFYLLALAPVVLRNSEGAFQKLNTIFCWATFINNKLPLYSIVV